MKSLKKAAEKLCDTAIGEGVKFPERWRRPMILRACSSTLVSAAKKHLFVIILLIKIHLE